MVTPQKVHGADISHHQSQVNLSSAKKAGLQWLYHKASEGDSYVDPTYNARRKQAAEAGLPFGAYHFARASKGDAEAEALRFLAAAKPKPGDLRPALDLETDEGMSLADLRTWADTFCKTVAKAIGVQPVIYTPFDLGVAQRDRLIWRPRYNSTNTPPTLRWDIWQFSNGQYGVPKSIAGLGNVDLNTMAPHLRTAQLLIPKPKPKPEEKKDRVHIVHAPMQFSIGPKAHTADIEAIFARESKRGAMIISGTEAGPGANNTGAELVRIGKKYGYRMWVPSEQSKKAGSSTDCWIGVLEKEILGGWKTGFLPAIPGSSELYKAQGIDPGSFPRWGPKGLVFVEFDSRFGPWRHGAAHYLTKARSPKDAEIKGVDHWEWNKKLTEVIAAWAKEAGAGNAICTYAGDQNMADAKNDEPQGDTFMGGPLTSLADELEKWVNTGHGPIDVIATYDKDGRVEAAYWRALDDKEFPLEVDHFLCEGGVDVKLLKTK